MFEGADYGVVVAHTTSSACGLTVKPVAARDENARGVNVTIGVRLAIRRSGVDTGISDIRLPARLEFRPARLTVFRGAAV